MLKPTKTSVIIAACVLLTGCVTTGPGNQPRTAVDRAINQCVASLVGGALLGALIGEVAGGKAGKGAAIGAAAGGAACVVLVAVADEKDRARIREQQNLAVITGQKQQIQYVNEEGDRVSVITEISDTPVRDEEVISAYSNWAPAASDGDSLLECRRFNESAVSLDAAGISVVCAQEDGSWVSLSEEEYRMRAEGGSVYLSSAPESGNAAAQALNDDEIVFVGDTSGEILALEELPQLEPKCRKLNTGFMVENKGMTGLNDTLHCIGANGMPFDATA